MTHICDGKLNHFFFFTQLYFTIFTFFVTTRQRSTYKQSMMDYYVRTLACIGILETSYDNKTHNNAPTKLSLVQVMACRLFGDKLLSEPVLDYVASRTIGNKFQ